MKQLLLFFSVLFVMASQTSCVTYVDRGPNGRDGRAYFGVDYSYYMPYSYWDDNIDIPLNPHLGEFYDTRPGTYEFEYFINPFDYWYGTYRIWVERGTEGGAYGEPGLDGRDTYLMLICDPDGWSEERFLEGKNLLDVDRSPGHVKYTMEENGQFFEVEMFRTDVLERTPKGDRSVKGY